MVAAQERGDEVTGRSLDAEDFQREVNPMRLELKSLLKEIRHLEGRIKALEDDRADHSHS